MRPIGPCLESIITFNDVMQLIDEHSVFAITDSEGILTYVNDKFVELSKYSKEELIGKNHNILRSDEHPNEFFADLWNTILSGNIWHGEIKNKAKDGTLYWLKTTIRSFVDEKNMIIGFVTLRADITEQKKQQELLEEKDELLQIKNLKLEAKLLEQQKQNIKNERMTSIGELASRMSHDLRNPLSIIRMSLENLKLEYGGDLKFKESLPRINRAINRMSHQIDDVLDFVKEQPLILNKIRICDVITDAIDSMLIPNYITLKLPKNDFELICDKRKLSVVLINLILNGIQSIDNKGIVEIRLKENMDNVVIEVEDSGEGIPKEGQARIFDPLFTTKQHGTGLGLASVKSIIESHKGTISITSPPTIFTITLPKSQDKKEN